MRFHLPAFPHTETTAKYVNCAFTQKVVKFSKMMMARGHEVFLYGGATNDAPCTEFISCVTEEERKGWFGEWNPNEPPDTNWDSKAPQWVTMNGRALAAMASRVKKGDVLCLPMGWSQKVLADHFPQALCVENGVGYEGIVGDFPCAFESYAWMHHVYGLKQIRDGRDQDAVIPNYFDPEDFPEPPTYNLGEKYLLFVGRVITRKGVKRAIEIAEKAEMELVVAGPRGAGVNHVEIPRGVDVTGPVDAVRRNQLMRGAAATLCPTQYIEAFCGVHAEAMMAGCPVITSDWGAFTETVVPGTGFRVRSTEEGAEAVRLCKDLDRKAIRQYALNNFALGPVGERFELWIKRLQGG